jgi:hypothetical protein
VTALPKLCSLLSSLLFRRRFEDDKDAEWRFHIETRTFDLIEQGLSAADAPGAKRRGPVD